MTPEQAKTQAQYLEALERERENEKYAEAKRMSKSVSRNVRNMAQIIFSHTFGEGDCICNTCTRDDY